MAGQPFTGISLRNEETQKNIPFDSDCVWPMADLSRL